MALPGNEASKETVFKKGGFTLYCEGNSSTGVPSFIVGQQEVALTSIRKPGNSCFY